MNRVKHIPFTIEGKDYIADILEKNGKDMVAIKPICSAVGITEHRQAQRLEDNPQFNPQHMLVVAGDRRQRKMICLPVEELGMWLCTINSRRIKESTREILVSFQRYCQVELHAAITGQAGIKRVEELEKEVRSLKRQVDVLTRAMEVQNATLSMHQQQISQYNDSEQLLASVGGKMMARAKKTKSIRNLH